MADSILSQLKGRFFKGTVAEATAVASEMPPSQQSTGEISPALVKLSHAIAQTPALVWLGISGLLMAVIYWFAFTQRYSLQEFGHEAMQSIATINGFSAEGAFLYIFGFIALFGLYWFGMRLGKIGPAYLSGRAKWIMVGLFAVIFNLTLLPMHILDAADIYDYIIRGRMSAVYGMNPMLDAPSSSIAVQHDEFYSFAAWHNVPSAYGPAWEMIAALGSKIAGNDFITNVIVFKLISIIGYAVTALFVLLTLRVIAPKRALLGFYLWAWNPLVVYMTAARGHNDTIMMACMMAGIYCLVKRWYVAGTLAALLGALVKFIPVLLIPVIAIVALRELSNKLRVRFVVLCAVLGVIMLGAFYGPYWHGASITDLLGINRRTAMYTGSVATILRQTLGFSMDGVTSGDRDEANNTPNANNLIKYLALGSLAIFTILELWDVWEKRDPTQPIRSLTRILMFYLLVSCLWFQSWYVLWVIGLVAVLDNSPLRRLVLLFSYIVLWETLLYNYVTLRPGDWMPLPWRDLIPVAVVMGTAWGYVAWFWISTWLRSGTRTPYSLALGQRLQSARQAATLSPAMLADDLDMHTDNLLSYERGDQLMPLEKVRQFCRRLGLSLTEFTAWGGDAQPSSAP